MNDQQPYRMIIRHSIIGLPLGATYKLRFDQIRDVFPPGMVATKSTRMHWPTCALLPTMWAAA